MRWVRYVARMGDRKSAYRFWWRDLRKRDHLEELGVDGMIILKLICKQWDGRHGLD
jgi:hypothetical protein